MGKNFDFGKFFAGTLLLAGGVALAMANPFFGAVVIGAAMGSFGSGLVQQGLGLGVASLQSAITGTSLSTENPVPVIYGEAFTGAKVAFYGVKNNRGDILDAAYVLCHGSQNGDGVEAIREIYADGNLAVAAGAPDLAPHDRLLPSTESFFNQNVLADLGFNVYLRYAKHLGYAWQKVDSYLNKNYPVKWPITSRGAGLAYLVCKFRHDPDGKRFIGLPQITAVVRGNKVLDTRTSTWGWTPNPALILYDYLTSFVYGVNLDSAMINIPAINTEADYCDELISIPDGAGGSINVPRFQFNGVLDTGNTLEENIDAILSAMRGFLVYQDGQFRLVIRKSQAATGYVLNEDNIIGNISLIKPGDDDSPNVIEISYVDKDNNWSPLTFEWPDPSDTTLIQADGDKRNVHPLVLVAETNRYRARHHAQTVLLEKRNSISVGLLAQEEAFQLEVGDVVTLDHSVLGSLSPKDFWVMAVGLNNNSTVALHLVEYHDAAYTAPTLGDIPDQPTPSLPTPRILSDPVNVDVTATLACSGAVVPHPVFTITWDDPADTTGIDNYEVQWREDNPIGPWSTSIIEPFQSVATPPTTYTVVQSLPKFDSNAVRVRVRSIGTIGNSNWVEDTLDLTTVRSAPSAVGITDPPDIAITEIGGSLHITVDVTGSNGTIFKIWMSGTPGFTPSNQNFVQQVAPNVFPAPDSVTFVVSSPVATGKTFYFRIGVGDCWTQPWGESFSISSEFNAVYGGPVSSGQSFAFKNHGSVSGNVIVDFTEAWVHQITTSGNIDITFQGIQAPRVCEVRIINTGGFTVTWNGPPKWHSGATPAQNAGAGGHTYTFTCYGSVVADILGQQKGFAYA